MRKMGSQVATAEILGKSGKFRDGNVDKVLRHTTSCEDDGKRTARPRWIDRRLLRARGSQDGASKASEVELIGNKKKGL